MQCPYCREDIIDGAPVCRFCGRDQPLSAKAKRAKNERYRRRFLIGIGISLGVILISFAAWSVAKTADQERMMRAAARCANITYDQLEALALDGAKKSNMSEWQSERMVAHYACPSLP